MTYAEKYVNKEYVVNNTEEFSNEFMKWIKKQDKSFYVDIDKMEELLIKFLQQEIKPLLSEDEKVILKNIGPRYIRIARTSINKDLYVTNNDKTIQHFLFAFNHLFQSIKPGEEYKISDLLEE